MFLIFIMIYYESRKSIQRQEYVHIFWSLFYDNGFYVQKQIPFRFKILNVQIIKIQQKFFFVSSIANKIL